MNTTEKKVIVSSIDHRLSALKIELERIYQEQDRLLHKIHPELRQDFCMTRASRIRDLAATETENHWLLRTWIPDE